MFNKTTPSSLITPPKLNCPSFPSSAVQYLAFRNMPRSNDTIIPLPPSLSHLPPRLWLIACLIKGSSMTPCMVAARGRKWTVKEGKTEVGSIDRLFCSGATFSQQSCTSRSNPRECVRLAGKCPRVSRLSCGLLQLNDAYACKGLYPNSREAF